MYPIPMNPPSSNPQYRPRLPYTVPQYTSGTTKHGTAITSPTAKFSLRAKPGCGANAHAATATGNINKKMLINENRNLPRPSITDFIQKEMLGPPRWSAIVLG